MIITTGTQITFDTLYLTTDTDLSGVVTVITYPAGVEYLSHVGDGTFDGTNWTADVTVAGDPQELTITATVTDVTSFAALSEANRKLTAITTAAPLETNTADNTQYRYITDIACPDLFACFESFAAQIPAYDSMDEAFLALGAGHWFKYTVTNIDGATAGSVHITEDLGSS